MNETPRAASPLCRRWVAAAVTAAVTAAVPALAPAASGSAEYTDTHPPVGVTVRESAGARLLEATVPGELLDWTAPRATDGRRRIYILATIEDDPDGRSTLYSVTSGRAELVALATGLAAEIDSLAAFDLDEDGAEELLVGQPGRIWRARPRDGGSGLELEPWLAAPGLDLGARLPDTGDGTLSLPAVGRLRRYSVRSGALEVVEYPLPRTASRHLDGLRLTSPRSTLLHAEGEAVYAVGPEAVGDRRLRTTLLAETASPEDASPEDDRQEAWSRLPAPERVQWSWFDVLDGRPILVVTTNSAEKLGVLERQNLRLFALRADRTQAGAGPWLAAQTSSRRWQQVRPWVVDVENDGDDDLVVAQFDGLGGGKVKLEAFVNSGDRSFLPRTRSTVIERSAASWHYGDDLTADGLPDLVLFSEGALEVFPAVARAGSRLVARQPLWSFGGGDIPRVEHSVELGAGGVAVHDGRPSKIGVPRALDLDGDGRLELVVAENPQWGFGRLRVVSCRAAAARRLQPRRSRVPAWKRSSSAPRSGSPRA